MTASYRISVQQIDEIYNLVLQRPPSKAVFQLLKQVQKTIQARNKKIQIYTWTVEALQRQHQRRQCEDRLLVERHNAHMAKLTQHKLQLETDIHSYTKEIQAQDPHLQTARDHAHTCQSKLQDRQRQFHRYAKIPVVGYSYKRKYLRAQKKTQDAESRVAAQRHVIDRLKEKRMMAAQRIRQELKEQAQLVMDVDGIRSRMTDRHALDMAWKEGLAFWTKTMAPLCLAVEQKVVALQHLLRKQHDDDQDDDDDDGGTAGAHKRQQQQELVSVLKAFRYACLNFEKMETYGDDQQQKKWQLEKVDFDCAKCMQWIHQGTPTPSKTKPLDILCSPCYQSSRTTMIIKKKLGFTHSSSPSSLSSLYSASSPPVTPSTSRQSSYIIDSSSSTCPPTYSNHYPLYSPPHPPLKT